MRLSSGHRTKTALAVEALRDAILRGEIAQSAPLTVTSLAAQLGMSPTPVREALRTLQAEGLLRAEPHHSALVTHYSVKDIHDIFALRADLESQATRLAVPRLRDEQLEALDDMQRAMRTAAQQNDIELLNRLNADWHLLIYGAAENRVLLELVQHLWKKFMFEINWIQPDGAERSLEQHDRLLAAIHARDTDEAAAAIRAHISRAEAVAIADVESRQQRSEPAIQEVIRG